MKLFVLQPLVHEEAIDMSNRWAEISMWLLYTLYMLYIYSYIPAISFRASSPAKEVINIDAMHST